MVEVRFEHEFEYRAEKLWAVIADFGDVSWVPGVEKVELEGEGVGMVRHLTVPVFPQLHERLEAIDHATMTLDYSIPAVEYLCVKNYRARAQVEALAGERCRVVWSGVAEAEGAEEAEAAVKTEAFYAAIMDWIGDHLKRAEVETAAPVDSATGDTGSGERRFEIEGRSLGFPAKFRDGSSAVGLFVVPARAAGELIRESGFEVAPVAPGRALMSVSCVHYRDSDCDVYNELSLAFFVKKLGPARGLPYIGTWIDIVRDEAATFVWKLPVTTQLANDAGVYMWGFPKTVEEIDFDLSGGRASFRLRMDGQDVLSYSVRAEGKSNQPHSASPVYTLYEGTPHVTYLGHEYRDVGIRPGGGRLQLGDHPIADQLRGLGLPRRPLIAMWMGGLTFDVGAPQKL
jgi:hypothetical protein